MKKYDGIKLLDITIKENKAIFENKRVLNRIFIAKIICLSLMVLAAFSHKILPGKITDAIGNFVKTAICYDMSFSESGESIGESSIAAYLFGD